MKKSLPFLILLLVVIGCVPPKRTETPANAPTATSEQNNEYLKFIEIRNAETDRTALGDDGIFGEVKNTGNKTVTQLEVRAFLLDKNGKAVSEEDFPVIFEGSFDPEGSQPLKPNYSRKFGFKIDPPSDWSKKFEVKVIRVTAN